MKEEITITIKNCVGNKVVFDYDNDGGRTRLAKPYRPKWRNAKFRLPSGKPKCEQFPSESTNEEILKDISFKYQNFKFKL